MLATSKSDDDNVCNLGRAKSKGGEYFSHKMIGYLKSCSEAKTSSYYNLFCLEPLEDF